MEHLERGGRKRNPYSTRNEEQRAYSHILDVKMKAQLTAQGADTATKVKASNHPK